MYRKLSPVYINYRLGQFTRNYTQTTKRGLLTTKQAEYQAPEEVRDIQPVLLSGVSKGACPLAHDFAFIYYNISP